MKTLHNSDIAGTKVNVPDVKVVGDGNLFHLLAKASSKSEGWMKSTKAMVVPGGCVVQVSTQQGDHVAEALVFVPQTGLGPDINGGRKLVPGNSLGGKVVK